MTAGAVGIGIVGLATLVITLWRRVDRLEREVSRRAGTKPSSILLLRHGEVRILIGDISLPM